MYWEIFTCIMRYEVLKKISKYKTDHLKHEFILSGILLHCAEANIIKYFIIHGSFIPKNIHLYYSLLSGILISLKSFPQKYILFHSSYCYILSTIPGDSRCYNNLAKWRSPWDEQCRHRVMSSSCGPDCRYVPLSSS
jgi:hypothetical protein